MLLYPHPINEAREARGALPGEFVLAQRLRRRAAGRRDGDVAIDADACAVRCSTATAGVGGRRGRNSTTAPLAALLQRARARRPNRADLVRRARRAALRRVARSLWRRLGAALARARRRRRAGVALMAHRPPDACTARCAAAGRLGSRAGRRAPAARAPVRGARRARRRRARRRSGAPAAARRAARQRRGGALARRRDRRRPAHLHRRRLRLRRRHRLRRRAARPARCSARPGTSTTWCRTASYTATA